MPRKPTSGGSPTSDSLRTSVREETRNKIQQIARDLNYFVNRNAAGLRTHQSNTIALLMFDETGGDEAQINPFFLSMLGYITTCAADLGYHVLVSMQQLTNDWHIEYQASHRADGLILLGYGDYLAYREKLEQLVSAGAHFVLWGPTQVGQPGHAGPKGKTYEKKSDARSVHRPKRRSLATPARGQQAARRAAAAQVLLRVTPGGPLSNPG